VERAFWCTEKPRFWVQRRDNELTSQARDLGDKSLQPLTVELRGGIIQEQRRSCLGEVLE
jgi:hypothetical protein